MAKKFEYNTVLIKGGQLGVYAEFPFESAKEFGTRKAVRVNATFDGKTYNMNLLPHGNGTHWLHLKKEIRDAIGKNEGDSVHIIIERDDSTPKIEIPDYLKWLLENDKEMNKRFQKLPISAKKFWIGHISETKSDETKVDRINHFFEFLIKQYK